MDRWNPFAEISRLQDEVVNRWTDRRQMAFQPLVDIFEDKDAIFVRAELPGVKADDVNINVENNVLTLTGERKLDNDENREGYHRIERAYGNFTRSFQLPNTVDAQHIEASLTDGVLSLRLPRRAETQPRRIEVKTTAPGKTVDVKSAPPLDKNGPRPQH